MSFKSRLRKLLEEKEPDRQLQDPQKNAKKTQRADPLERLAALKEAGWDLTILLSRASGTSAGATNKHWHITEIDPMTFYDLVSEVLGGGSYRMSFRKDDATLLRLEGSDQIETHTFAVAGKPKMTGEAPVVVPKEKGIDWTELLKEGSIGALLIKSFFERTKPDETLMELLKATLSGNGNKTDAGTLLNNVTETLVKLKDAASDNGGVDPMTYINQFMTMLNQYNQNMRPPVSTTGSSSSGLDRFFESLGNAAPAIVPLLAGALGGGGSPPAATPSALPTGTPENTELPPSNGTGSEPDAGAPDSPPETPPNPLAAFGAPDLGGAKDLTPQSAAFGAIMKLRYMIGQQADPLDIASEMVDTINLIQGAKRVEGVWENYIADPGEAFDQFAPLINEWSEHPEYKTECREAMVKAVTDYFDTEEPEETEEAVITEETPETEEAIITEASDTEETQEIETHDLKTDTQPPSAEPETPINDSVEGTGNDAGADTDSRVNG